MGRERTAFKTDAILADLRNRFLAGELQPGDRLPTRADLEQSFAVSRATIQEVFDRLADDGFIAANGRNGTCVVPYPPHLHRIALVAPWAAPEENRFWLALQRTAETLGRHPVQSIVIHAGVQPRRDNAIHRALCAEAHAGRLAGVVFASPPSGLVDDTFPTAPGLPRVAIMRGRCPDGSTPTVYPAEVAMFERAAAYFARRGRRRIALIGHLTDHPVHMTAALAVHGITGAPWRLQTVPLEQPSAARACAHLLFAGPAADRPDGLLISDDNLVEAATMGVCDAGAQNDVDILGHCNFPWPTPSSLPIRRLGYDARRVLGLCLDALATLRAGRSVADVMVQPVFDDELGPDTG